MTEDGVPTGAARSTKEITDGSTFMVWFLLKLFCSRSSYFFKHTFAKLLRANFREGLLLVCKFICFLKISFKLIWGSNPDRRRISRCY